MKKILLGILVLMLLIGTVIVPITGGITLYKPLSPGIIDQEQPNTSESYFLENGIEHYQTFKNRGMILEEVQVHIGVYYGDSAPLKLSIQRPLGNVLTSLTLPTASIPSDVQDWCTFDVPDRILLPGMIYFIVLTFGPESEYAWSGAHGDPYTKGKSSHTDPDWDSAFRTIVSKLWKSDNNKVGENVPVLYHIICKLIGYFPLLEKLLFY